MSELDHYDSERFKIGENLKTRSRDSINGRARIWDMVGGVAGLTEIILNPVNPKIGPML